MNQSVPVNYKNQYSKIYSINSLDKCNFFCIFLYFYLFLLSSLSIFHSKNVLLIELNQTSLRKSFSSEIVFLCIFLWVIIWKITKFVITRRHLYTSINNFIATKHKAKKKKSEVKRYKYANFPIQIV